MTTVTGIQSLIETVRGQVIQPHDPDYEQTRRVYNAMIDKHPGVIVRCADAADVMATVTFAREHDVLLAIRGGGHSGAGLGTCDGGVVADLSLMRSVRVDVKERTVRVDGGCTLGDMDHATHAFGLATPSGVLSTTGVAGLTLGGGVGHLTRKYGLAVDNLLEVDVVLADGRFVTASERENSDLFWAIRGGGGNFGAVTSFLFRAHPVSTIIGGPTLWPLEQAAEVMKWYRDFTSAAPEDLNGTLSLVTVPPAPPFPEELHLQKMCSVMWCYAGPGERAEEVFRPVREFGPPALYGIQPMPFPTLQTAFDAVYPRGLQWYWRPDFLDELTDEAIDQHVKYAQQLPTMHSCMLMHPIDGVAHRVGADDMAFNYRNARWAATIVGCDPDPANNERIISWATNYWEAIHPYSAGGAYVNFMMEEGQDRVRAAYRDNYDRLAEIKRKYDPTNLFRVNQNIKPND